jgi:hypothetical protein
MYLFEVQQADFKNASTGAEMIVAKLKVLEGPYAGRQLFTNFVLSPDNPFALRRFFLHMAALGIDNLEAVAPGGNMELLARAVTGRRAYAEIGTRTWQGSERNEVKAIAAAGGPGVSSGGLPGIPAVAPAGVPAVGVPSVPTSVPPARDVPPPPTPQAVSPPPTVPAPPVMPAPQQLPEPTSASAPAQLPVPPQPAF